MDVTKDISRRKLLQVLGSSVAGMSLAPFAPMLPAPLDLEKLTAARPVLIGDSYPRLARDLHDIFEYEKIHSIYSTDPYESLEICRTQPISVFFVDFNYPMLRDIDGFDVIQMLKNDSKTRHIPIVFITARMGKENQDRGIKLGAEAYFLKPYDAEEMNVFARHLLMTRVKW